MKRDDYNELMDEWKAEVSVINASAKAAAKQQKTEFKQLQKKAKEIAKKEKRNKKAQTPGPPDKMFNKVVSLLGSDGLFFVLTYIPDLQVTYLPSHHHHCQTEHFRFAL